LEFFNLYSPILLLFIIICELGRWTIIFEIKLTRQGIGSGRSFKTKYRKFPEIFFSGNDTNPSGWKWMKVLQRKRKLGGIGIR
jgi:hypothetical protein